MEPHNDQELRDRYKAAMSLLEEVCKLYIGTRHLAEELGLGMLETNKLLIHAGMIAFKDRAYELTERSIKNGWARPTETGIKWTVLGRIEARANLIEIRSRGIDISKLRRKG